MALELTRPPMSVFFMPTLHSGLEYVKPEPRWLVRPAKGAEVALFAGSDNDALFLEQDADIGVQKERLPGTVFEIRCAPVVLTEARFRNSFAMIGGRIWLNGAAGTRMRNKYGVNNRVEWRRKRLLSAFMRARRDGQGALSSYKGDAGKLDIALELRNAFNYYHFTTESLGALAHFVKDDTGRPIRFHMPRGEVRSFVRGFVQAVFPEIADRVEFEAAPISYDAVRSVYSHQHYLYQVNDARVMKAMAAEGVDPLWPEIVHDATATKEVMTASFDSSLRMLRQAALKQVSRAKVKSMPRLVWMGRDERGGGARSRGLSGHQPLLEELKSRGFEVMAFENLSPLDQIAAAHSADILIAPHGAGLANMTYAKPGALIIEIGTRQTQRHRWGDFLPCAHVSGCRYATVFADVIGFDGSSDMPPVRDGLLGVHVGRRATEQIIRLLDAEMSGTRKKEQAHA